MENSESIQVKLIVFIQNKFQWWTKVKPPCILQKLVEAFEELRLTAEADQQEIHKGFSFYLCCWFPATRAKSLVFFIYLFIYSFR